MLPRAVAAQVGRERAADTVSTLGLEQGLVSLTTVHVPAVDMGQRAADYLLARIHGLEPSLHTRLEADLIVRGTTAPPAAPARD